MHDVYIIIIILAIIIGEFKARGLIQIDSRCTFMVTFPTLENARKLITHYRSPIHNKNIGAQ